MIYCFDLDGTLCTHDPDGEYDKADPLMERIGQVRRLHEEGHTILIDSARGSGTGIDWEAETVRQLAQWGVPYHKLRVGVKLYADKYIDDKAYFTEEFFGC